MNKSEDQIRKNKLKKTKSTKKCQICRRLKENKYAFGMLNQALFNKFSTNKIYYKKVMMKYIRNLRTANVILFKYNISCEDKEEYLTEYFKKKQRLEKMKLIKQYYKFHNEVPRWFMKPIDMMMRKYHDKQRKLKFAQLEQRIRSKDWNSLNIFTESNSQGVGMIQADYNNESHQIINQSQLLKSYLQSFYKKEIEEQQDQLDRNMQEQEDTLQVLYDLLNGLEFNNLSLISCDEYETPDEQFCKKTLQKCKKNKKLQSLDKIEAVKKNDDSVMSIDQDLQEQIQKTNPDTVGLLNSQLMSIDENNFDNQQQNENGVQKQLQEEQELLQQQLQQLEQERNLDEFENYQNLKTENIPDNVEDQDLIEGKQLEPDHVDSQEQLKQQNLMDSGAKDIDENIQIEDQSVEQQEQLENQKDYIQHQEDHMQIGSEELLQQDSANLDQQDIQQPDNIQQGNQENLEMQPQLTTQQLEEEQRKQKQHQQQQDEQQQAEQQQVEQQQAEQQQVDYQQQETDQQIEQKQQEQQQQLQSLRPEEDQQNQLQQQQQQQQKELLEQSKQQDSMQAEEQQQLQSQMMLEQQDDEQASQQRSIMQAETVNSQYQQSPIKLEDNYRDNQILQNAMDDDEFQDKLLNDEEVQKKHLDSVDFNELAEEDPKIMENMKKNASYLKDKALEEGYQQSKEYSDNENELNYQMQSLIEMMKKDPNFHKRLKNDPEFEQKIRNDPRFEELFKVDPDLLEKIKEDPQYLQNLQDKSYTSEMNTFNLQSNDRQKKMDDEQFNKMFNQNDTHNISEFQQDDLGDPREIQTSLTKRDLSNQFGDDRQQNTEMGLNDLDLTQDNKLSKREQIIQMLKKDRNNIDNIFNIIEESDISDDIIETVSHNEHDKQNSSDEDNQFKRRRSLVAKQNKNFNVNPVRNPKRVHFQMDQSNPNFKSSSILNSSKMNNSSSFMKKGKGGYFSQKQLMNKALFMNKEELQELLDRVNMRINYNNKINNRLVSAYRKTKFGIKYDVTSKYLRNLQKTEKFLNTLIKKKDVSAKVRTRFGRDDRSRIYEDYQKLQQERTNQLMKNMINYKQQKKIFGKDWIKMNKFDVLQKSSHNNQFRNDLVQQYKQKQLERQQMLNQQEQQQVMNQQYNNPYGQQFLNASPQELRNLMAMNMLGNSKQQEIEELKRKEIQDRLRKNEIDKKSKLSGQQNLYCQPKKQKKFVIKKSQSKPKMHENENTTEEKSLMSTQQNFRKVNKENMRVGGSQQKSQHQDKTHVTVIRNPSLNSRQQSRSNQVRLPSVSSKKQY